MTDGRSMTAVTTLAHFLKQLERRAGVHAAVGETMAAIAAAAAKLSNVIRATQDLGSEGATNIQGEVQKRLDLMAHDAFVDAAKASPVAWVLSEEEADVIKINPKGTLALAFDPLDGSSNIAVNGAMGTIFSLLPAKASGEGSFLQPGLAQLAAAYIVYGAQTLMGLTVGDGTHVFALDPTSQAFVATGQQRVPVEVADFSINMSNYRHWPLAYRNFIDDCLKGSAGPLARDYNMRWLGAAVGEAHRILTHGGLYMYPADARKGSEAGRLRLIYECNPIALLMREAGGHASDGATPILDIVPASLHARCGLCFGSAGEMKRLNGYLSSGQGEASPLFNKRGLFTVQD
jgi:fructose-1,6-bisphosphatase I